RPGGQNLTTSDLTLIVWREEQERGHQNAVQQELEVNSLGKEKRSTPKHQARGSQISKYQP
ncbi:unnamed protein product, partial [Arctogadus glacialis]